METMNNSMSQRTFTITATVKNKITESILWNELDKKSSKEKSLEKHKGENSVKSKEEKNERIKEYLTYSLSKELTNLFNMKFLKEENISIFSFEVTDIQIDSNKLHIRIKTVNRFLEYIGLDVDLAALTISRWLPDIFASILKIEIGELNSHIHWETKFSLTKTNKPKEGFTSYIDDWLKIFLKTSTIMARGYLMSSPFILSHLITVHESTFNNQIRGILELRSRPIQVHIEQESGSCSCGFCDRCRTDCSPC